MSLMPNLQHLRLRHNWDDEGWEGSMEHLEACLPQLSVLVLTGTATTLAAREAFHSRILAEEESGHGIITFHCRANEVP